MASSKEYFAEYRAKNRKALREYKKAWRLANQEQQRQKTAEYYEVNKEQIKQYQLDYKKQNPAKVNALSKKRKTGKKQRTPTWLTEIHFERMETQYKLANILTKLTGQLHHVDHIIPLHGKNVSGLHTPTNLQVIPAKQNLQKGISFNVIS
jgi:hypothetical protein